MTRTTALFRSFKPLLTAIAAFAVYGCTANRSWTEDFNRWPLFDSNELATPNPHKGKQTVTVTMTIPSAYHVTIHVHYNATKRNDRCYKEVDSPIGAIGSSFSKRMSYSLLSGQSMQDIPLDEILPGDCGLEARFLDIDVQDTTFGTKNIYGKAVLKIPIRHDGVGEFPKQVVSCRPFPVNLAPETTIQLRCETHGDSLVIENLEKGINIGHSAITYEFRSEWKPR